MAEASNPEDNFSSNPEIKSFVGLLKSFLPNEDVGNLFTSRIPYEEAFDSMHGECDPFSEEENPQFIIPSYGQEFVKEGFRDGTDEGKDDSIPHYVPETQFPYENDEVCF